MGVAGEEARVRTHAWSGEEAGSGTEEVRREWSQLVQNWKLGIYLNLSYIIAPYFCGSGEFSPLFASDCPFDLIFAWFLI